MTLKEVMESSRNQPANPIVFVFEKSLTRNELLRFSVARSRSKRPMANVRMASNLQGLVHPSTISGRVRRLHLSVPSKFPRSPRARPKSPWLQRQDRLRKPSSRKLCHIRSLQLRQRFQEPLGKAQDHDRRAKQAPGATPAPSKLISILALREG